MSEDKKDDAPQARGTWADIKRMADEVKVKLHLAGMEAKEKWKTLEPKINELSDKVEKKGERAADVVGDQVSAVFKALGQLAEKVQADLELRKKDRAEGKPAEAAPAPAPAEPKKE